jgi:hypothetical protein
MSRIVRERALVEKRRELGLFGWELHAPRIVPIGEPSASDSIWNAIPDGLPGQPYARQTEEAPARSVLASPALMPANGREVPRDTLAGPAE